MSRKGKKREEKQKEHAPAPASSSPTLSFSSAAPATTSSQGTKPINLSEPNQPDKVAVSPKQTLPSPDGIDEPSPDVINKPSPDEIIKVNIRNWLFYGVILSILAILIAIACDLIMGYHWSQVRFQRLPDFLLAIFAVAVNLKSLIISDGEKVSFSDRDLYDKLSLFFMLFTVGVYASVYAVADKISKNWSIGLFCTSIAILLGSAYIGIRIEQKNDV